MEDSLIKASGEFGKNVNVGLPWLSEQEGVFCFASVVENQRGAAADTIGKIAEAAFAAAGLKDSFQQDVEYVVDMPESVKKAVRVGLMKFDVNNDGEMFAQIRDARGHYGKKFPIREQVAAKGIDPVQALNALQLQAISAQLTEMAGTLDAIQDDVLTVVKGQVNDRIALYHAGYNLYIEACNMHDETMRRFLTAQSIAALSDAKAKMTLQLLDDMRYLLEGEYNGKKKVREKAIESKVSSIEKCLEVIHRASVLKAEIYFESEETQAMLLAIDEYARFLGSVVVPNAKKLSEFDPSDTLLKGGKWEKRAEILAEMEKAKAMLSSGKQTFYLDVAKEPDDEG